MTASPENFKNAVDIAREDGSLGQKQWVRPGLTRMAAGVAEFGGSTSGDGNSGLS